MFYGVLTSADGRLLSSSNYQDRVRRACNNKDFFTERAYRHEHVGIPYKSIPFRARRRLMMKSKDISRAHIFS
jgi:hypothetical protein